MLEKENVFSVQGLNLNYEMYLPQYSTDYIQRKISTSGRPYEEKLLNDMLERTSPGDLILDVGANIGNHSIFLAMHQRQVVAFEPNSELVDSFRKSINLNNLSEVIDLKEVAVGAANDNASMENLRSDNLGMAKIAIGSGEVTVVPIDELDFPEPVKAIKIDVEGMEESVLSGAVKLIARDKPILYIESANVALLSTLLRTGMLDDYIYLDTFNATATHLFMHKQMDEDLSLGATTITATTIFAQHEARSALTSDLERSNADLERSNADLERSNADLERSNAKLEKLKTNVQALMAENEKLEKKYTNLKRWGFILGLPSIVILSPIILPLFWVQRRKRRLRGGSTAKINSPR